MTTKTAGKTASAAVKDILFSNPDGLREVIRTVMQEVLEAEMDEALGAAKGERTHLLGWKRFAVDRSEPASRINCAMPRASFLSVFTASS
jgi:transposase-like protein